MAQGNTAVPHGDHDRVAMLSLRADGTPDQHNPEIVGDLAAALEATRRQFREQAVSAADSAARTADASGTAETVEQDPQIAQLQQAHDDIAAQAEVAADAAVAALVRRPETPAPTAPALDSGSKSKTR